MEQIGKGRTFCVAETPPSHITAVFCPGQSHIQQPVEFLGDDNGFVKKMRCLECSLGEPDSSGRRRPVPIEGSEFDIENLFQEIDSKATGFIDCVIRSGRRGGRWRRRERYHGQESGSDQAGDKYPGKVT